MIPYFPEHVFDGTWDKRENLQDVRPPDFGDYIRLSKELQATQDFILQNFRNLKGAPDTLATLQRVCQKAEKIEKNLEKAATPEQLDSYINSVEAKLDKILERQHLLQKSLAQLKLELIALNNRVKEIEVSWGTDVAGFQRYNRGEFARLKERVDSEVAELKQQLAALKDILE